MTVTAAEARVEYAGNGSTFVFPYPAQFFQNNDLEAWLFNDTSGEGEAQILGTDYTVLGAGEPTGGSVTFTVAPPGGFTVIIINNPDIVQPTHYVNADDFPARSHETALDRLTKICQRLSDRVDRSIRAPDYAPADQVPDANTLIEAVDDAQNAAISSATSASSAAASQITASAAAVTASAAAASASTDAASAAIDADAAEAAAIAADVNKLVWRGAWMAATAYLPNDGVQRSGSSYIAKTSNTNAAPESNPAIWDLLAQKGADGSGPGTGDMLRANNLGDVASITSARANLGLANSATRNVGTAAGTVAAGDDSRITGAAPLASPVFSGNPQAPTPAANDNDTSLATTAFVQNAVAAAVATGIADLPTGSIDFDELNPTAIATAAQYRANTANKILTTDKVWSAAAAVVLTDGAIVTPDFSTGFDFQLTLGAVGRTMANPTNAKEGQKGVIYIVQDAIGGRTITAWGTNWKFPGGIKPTLTAVGGSFDMISYAVGAGGLLFCTFAADFK